MTANKNPISLRRDAPENRAGTGDSAAPGAATRFRPGQSGNPGGRPKGLAARVREKTRDGEDVIETLVAIMNDPKARNSDRIAASQALLDRGVGKAPVVVSAAEGKPAGPDFEVMPDDDLRRYILRQVGVTSAEQVAVLLAGDDGGERV